ncbi:hypothetical protein BDZ85DRAFT_89200 [Elsinoe ampelina]|uniref:F-box domain-containing protein n=1 Tax=Elsinoe ampelina TaxID=302913 RepID=A0A6A6GI45_9PEZI|nr:hypothetical protein BDZ85DRAFT_89200 [Elsinoe ampelina]
MDCASPHATQLPQLSEDYYNNGLIIHTSLLVMAATQPLPMEDPATTHPAQDEVIANPYLVVAVLTKLPTQDILRCVRVCKDWKHLIDRSSELQERLFLKPTSAKADPETLHTFFEERCLSFDTDYSDDQHIEGHADVKIPYKTHPLLLGKPPLESSSLHGLGLYWGSTSARKLVESYKEGQSWQRMFITQPPVSQVHIALVGGDLGFDDWDLHVQQQVDSGGIRWADVVSTLTGKIDQRQLVLVDGKDGWEEGRREDRHGYVHGVICQLPGPSRRYWVEGLIIPNDVVATEGTRREAQRIGRPCWNPDRPFTS